jgi:hypothetical protein
MHQVINKQNLQSINSSEIHDGMEYNSDFDEELVEFKDLSKHSLEYQHEARAITKNDAA